MPSPRRLPQGMEGLDAGQRVALGHACRAAKETLFTDLKKNAAPVTVLGRGSKVIGGSIKTELTRDLLKKVMLDGFLPQLRADRPAAARAPGRPDRDRPAVRRRSGDHAPPGAVPGSAGRLAAHGRVDGAPLGGPVQRRRLQGGRAAPASPRGPLRLGRAGRSPSWNRPTSTWRWPTGPPITARSGAARACGSGAAWRGLTTSASKRPRRRSRAFAPPIKALCVVPMGMEEGTETDVPGPEIGLIVGEPAQFRFLGSTTRRDDVVGTMLERWNTEELQELDPAGDRAGSRRRRARASPCRSGCTRASPRSGRSSCRARAPATPGAGSWNSTCGSQRRLN